MRSVIKSIILASLIIWSFSNLGFAQLPNVSCVVTFQDQWSIYTLSDFNSNPNFFHISFTNNESYTVYGVMVDFDVYVNDCSDPSVADGLIGWGVTKGDNMLPNQTIDYWNNSEFKDDATRGAPWTGNEQAFEDAVINTGSALPAGVYRYEFRLLYDPVWVAAGHPGLYPPNPDEAVEIPGTYQNFTIVITQPAAPQLQYPGEPTEEGIPIYTANPTFQWLSTGATAGRRMYFSLLICEKEENQSNDEAIDNLPFFEIVWDDAIEITESGTAFPVTFSYPTSEQAFSAGNKYVWQVFVRDERNYIEDPSSGFTSESEIFCFQYGDTPQPVSPALDATVNDVTPAFLWTSALGAQGYQYRLSPDDDPQVENNYWEEDVSTTSINHAPENAVLVPGSTYFWKVRALPDGRWCLPSGFTVQEVALVNPSNASAVTTLAPLFTWTAPLGIQNWQMQIHGEVEQGIIEGIVGTNFIYPNNADLPLIPGKGYTWKVLPMFDDAVIGEEDIYPEFTFTVNPMELTQPGDGSTINTLNPLFMWNAPDLSPGDRYELRLSPAEDPEVLNPAYTYLTVDRSFVYPTNPDLTLISGETYYWRVTVYNTNTGVVGNVEDYPVADFTVQFTGELNLNIAIPSSTPLLPQFSWSSITSATSYRLIICNSQDNNDIFEEIENIAVTNYNYNSANEPLSFEVPYFAKVFALQNDQIVVESQFVTFTCSIEGLVPTLTVNVVPPNILSPVFVWSTVAGATNYQLFINNIADMSGYIWDQTTTLTSFTYPLTAPLLDFGATYYAWVQALNTEGEPYGLPSILTPFSIPEIDYGLTFIILENAPFSPNFNWQSIPLATAYLVRLNTSPNQSSWIWEGTFSITNMTYPLNAPPLILGATYYVWVQALNANGQEWGPPSPMIQIQLPTLGYNLTVLFPENQPLNPGFSWSLIPGAAKYLVRLNEGSETSSWIWEQLVTELSVGYPTTATALVAQTYYSVWVQALNNNDEPVAPPSNPVGFYTPATGTTTYNFPAPAPIAPINEVITDLWPTLSWNPVEGVSYYRASLSSNPEYTQIFWVNSSVNGTSITYPTAGAPILMPSTNYWWRVTCMNEQGQPISVPCEPSQFTTPSGEVILELIFGP
jgi:hypothetical protein